MKKTFLNLRNAAYVAVIASALTLTSCSKEKGCMNDPLADNYSDVAEEDDGSCIGGIEKFAGSWSLSGTVETFAFQNATFTITKVDATKATIKSVGINPSGVDFNILEAASAATLTANKVLTVNKTVGTHAYTGTITYSSGALTLAIVDTDSGAAVNINGTATK